VKIRTKKEQQIVDKQRKQEVVGLLAINEFYYLEVKQ
jgi:hypothetical protein